MSKRFQTLGVPAALILCAAALLFCVCVGSVRVEPAALWKVLTNQVEGIPATQVAIVRTIRLPRVLMAFCIGAALSVSGAVMQSVLRNGLASGYTMGVSSGASLGAGIAMFAGWNALGRWTLPFLGLSGGMLTVFLAVLLATRMDKRMQSHTIVLTGMVFSLFVNAVLTLLSSFMQQELERLVRWQMGSLALKQWKELAVLAPLTVLGVIGVFFHARELDAMTFGEEAAGALGVSTRRAKWMLLFLSASLTGASVAFAGVIGFVDLIVPHVVRKLHGARHRRIVPYCALYGGTFLALADLAARTLVAPRELPVGAVTALLGAPFFAYIYFRARRN